MFVKSFRNLLKYSSTATRVIYQNKNNFNAGNLIKRNLHILSWSTFNIISSIDQPKLLTSTGNPQLNQVAGFKVKGVVKRRCRDCYLVAEEGRVYNLCPTHPRHKQMSMKKKPKTEYIITHATQHKQRPW